MLANAHRATAGVGRMSGGWRLENIPSRLMPTLGEGLVDSNAASNKILMLGGINLLAGVRADGQSAVTTQY